MQSRANGLLELDAEKEDDWIGVGLYGCKRLGLGRAVGLARIICLWSKCHVRYALM